jgi:hypothetical protein
MISAGKRGDEVQRSVERSHQFSAPLCPLGHPEKQVLQKVAEGVGFEPTLRFPVNTLSKRAPSATRPPLLIAPVYIKCSTRAVAPTTWPPSELIERREPASAQQSRSLSPSPAAAGCHGAAGGVHYRPRPTSNNPNNRSFPQPTFISVNMFSLQQIDHSGIQRAIYVIKTDIKRRRR